MSRARACIGTWALGACALACVMAWSAPAPAAAQACGSGPSWLNEPAEEPLRLGVGTSIAVLNLPNLGAGLTLIAQVGTALPIDLTLSRYFDNSAELIVSERDLELVPAVVVPWPPGGSRSTFSLTQLGVALCPLRHDLGAGLLLGCGGAYGGVITAESEGFVDPADAVRVALGLEAYARWRYVLGGPIGLTYSAGLFVPLLRPGFGYVDGNGVFRELFRVSPLGGRLDVALTYAFE